MNEALRAKLLASAPLAALVATISWDERPQRGALPALVMTIVTPGREYEHGGWDGLNETRVQIDIWASDPVVALAITRAIPAAIEPETTLAGWVIGPSFLEAEDGGREDLGGQPLFRRRQDWMITNRPI